MTRNELSKEIIPKISEYLFSKSFIDEATHDDAEDNILMGKFDIACDILSAETSYQRLLEFLKNSLSNTDTISCSLNFRIVEAPDKDEYRLGEFCYKSTNLSILPMKYMKRYMDNAAISDTDIMAIVECILLKIKDDSALLEEFLGYCKTTNDKKYCILTNRTADKDWKQYAYAYLCYVNDKRFERPSELSFVADTKFLPSIPFDPDNKYEQYFDAYGVMSESKYADDVLIRYLRMYQIIEYFSFRKVLADMTKGNLKENGFVRHVLAVVKTGSNNEFDEIKKGLKSMFVAPSKLDAIIPFTDYSVAEKTFLENKMKIKLTSGNYTEDIICKIIYQLRNSIVHNKESELHFSYYNVDDYRDGIGIMKNYIAKLEPELVNLINDHSKTVLEFDEQFCKVY
ncbi:MAG: hypothetical protein Q4A15_00190 [Prevotellaceae bacterium]|nr:hypothetical protein [Prevotellaceae bacterium]